MTLDLGVAFFWFLLIYCNAVTFYNWIDNDFKKKPEIEQTAEKLFLTTGAAIAALYVGETTFFWVWSLFTAVNMHHLYKLVKKLK